MIVKDESKVIIRALDSVKSIVDNIFICDTGSTDLTKEIVELYLTHNKIPGKVVDSKWKNFGHNRTECFSLAQKTFPDTDYLMTLDADEIIVPWDQIPLDTKHANALPHLEGDTVYVKTCYGVIDYYRPTLFKASLPWKWKGVLHEYAYSEEATSSHRITSICNLPSTDGARSKNSNKYLDDAKILEKDLEENPEDARNWFYLAQSYADAGKPELAIVPTEKAFKYSKWGEEQFISLLRKARYKVNSGIAFEEVLGDYLAAYQHSPHRVEPLFDIIFHYRIKDKFTIAALFVETALAIPLPKTDILFVESSIYDWRLQDEATLVYHYMGQPQVAVAIAEIILEKPNLPSDARERIEKNMKWFKEAIKEDSKENKK